MSSHMFLYLPGQSFPLTSSSTILRLTGLLCGDGNDTPNHRGVSAAQSSSVARRRAPSVVPGVELQLKPVVLQQFLGQDSPIIGWKKTQTRPCSEVGHGFLLFLRVAMGCPCRTEDEEVFLPKEGSMSTSKGRHCKPRCLEQRARFARGS